MRELLRYCAHAARLDTPGRQLPGWVFGHHFFNCAAGSKTEGVTSMFGRHDALLRVFGNFYTSLGFTVYTNNQAGTDLLAREWAQG